MFEKEAIIHAFEETIGIECLNKPVEDFTYEELSDELQEKAYDFKKGAEFGYNKANEWHYMKDELPPKKVPLNIITFDKNKKRRVWVGEYDGGNGQWWTGYFNHFIDVPYAWREIILPEQEG